MDALETLSKRLDTLRIYQDIAKERIRQGNIWGDQSGNSRFLMACVLMEEVGEVARAFMENGPYAPESREELVHVAAVAVQLIEHIDKHNAAS